MHLPRIAIYPGTFDPLTLGHIDILERAALLFDKVILGIADNNHKTLMFSVAERVTCANVEVQALGLHNVVIKSFQGLLVDFAKKEAASVIIRGLRALSDFEYEFQMAYINRKLSRDLETIFLPATERGHFISSTIAKEVAKLGGDLTGLVTNSVAQMMNAKLSHAASLPAK